VILVVEPGQTAWRKIQQHFGGSVFHSDGTLDRDKLGQIVFSDSNKRALLSAITHPEIYRCIMWQLLKCLVQGWYVYQCCCHICSLYTNQLSGPAVLGVQGEIECNLLS
jgi:dephospho-CoA kinase